MKPYSVGAETFVVPLHVDVPGGGIVYLHPMVIRAKEPVLVDCGGPIHREQYLEAVFSLVDPKDVRWIFLSHDDRDHAGNLMQVLELCPKATLVTNFVAVARLMEEWSLPLERQIWVNNHESFDVGDRKLVALRPPLFDGPATRGLWDSKSGVYYSVDCFGAVVPHHCQEVGEVSPEKYRDGFNLFNRVNHPWHEYVDQVKFAELVNQVRKLRPGVIVSYHGPPARDRADELCDLLSAVGSMEPLQHPGQDVLAALRGVHAPGAPGNAAKKET